MADSESDVQDIAHFSFDWTIENMCACDYLMSPAFTVGKTEWGLLLSGKNISGFMELEIYRRGGDHENIQIKFELSFLGIDGLPLIKKKGSKQFREGDDFRFRNFADEAEVFVRKRAEFLPGGALTARCRMWRTGIENISKREICFARTLLREFRGSCLSEVKDFSKLRVGQMREIILKTPAEEAIPLSAHCFIKKEDDQQYVCIDIGENDIIEICNGKIKISVLNVKGDVVYSIEKNKFFHSTLVFGDVYEIRKLMNDKTSLLPDDVLSFRIEYELVAVVWSKIEKCINSSEFEESTPKMDKKNLDKQDEISAVPTTIAEALKILLQEGIMHDISLQAGTRSFPAHKCILSVRSPVFKAMFSGDMREKTRKCIEIPDVDEDTLGELLSYIYTDTIADLEWQGTAVLYKAADKYQLLDLKRRCSVILKSDLSVSSVCTVLVVADMHHDQGLLEAALDFVMQQGEEFFTCEEWQSFKEKNPKLAMETMERIFCKFKIHH